MHTLKVSYTPTEFAGLVERETTEIELKASATGRGMQESLVSFSNTHGGVIFVGVHDDRTVRGCSLTQKVQDSIDDAAHDAHDVGRFEVSEVGVGSVTVVAVQVYPRGDGFAQTSEGRVLVRRGARNRALIGPELTRWLADRSLHRLEITATEVPVSRCDSSALAEVCSGHGWDPVGPDLLDRLVERLLATRAGVLTVAGALLLTDPATSLSATKFVIDVRGFEDDLGTSYVRRDIVGGPVFGQVRNTVVLITRDLGHDQVVLGLRRHDLPRIPQAVLRETIANAVAHRAYEDGGTPVVVEIRPGRVVVRSPGSLLPGVTVSGLREAQKARNPVLIDELRRFRLAEDSGLGIDLIEDQMKAAFLRDPGFEADEESVTVSLPRDPYLSARERAWMNELAEEGALTPAERSLLTAAARGESLTNARAREITRVDSTEARRSLRRLTDRGLLTSHGARGGAMYTLGDVEPPRDASPPTDAAELVMTVAVDRRITNADVRQVAGIDRTMARLLLQRLVREGRLEQHGQRRWTYYTATS